MHTIQTEIRSGIITIGIAGFCTDAELDQFMLDLDDAVASIVATGRRHSILADYRHAAIQSQRTVAALQERITGSTHKARRVALFTLGQLAQMQAKRIASARDTIRVFDDREVALAWLAGDDDVPAAADAAAR